MHVYKFLVFVGYFVVVFEVVFLVLFCVYGMCVWWRWYKSIYACVCVCMVSVLFLFFIVVSLLFFNLYVALVKK